MWFEADELRKAKDENDKFSNWFDFDLWQDVEKFKATGSTRVCPTDSAQLYELSYSDSNIKIDACRTCNGIWLEKGEFESIIEYVKCQSSYEILHNYSKNLLQEGKEVFSGPESLQSEFADVLMLTKLFQYKFAAENPKITTILVNLPLA
jgi:Zn-finger nucleic acid-binding protein